MKKIYLTFSALTLCVSLIAQSNSKVPNRNPEKGELTVGAKIPNKSNYQNSKVQAGVFAIQIDPIEQIMTQKGLDLTNTNATLRNQETFLASVFQDSTVSLVTSSGASSANNDILLGVTFDPRSVLLQSSGEPICSKADSYKIDTVFIQGSYIKKTSDIDTLYTWLVWGDTTNTSVYTKMATSSVWVAPISGWRKSIIGPKLTGATGAAGNKVSAAAPATNKILIKYVLNTSDSVSSYGRTRFISIPLTSITMTAGITIPASNIVTCFYTFVPGGSHTLNQPMYSFSSGTVPTINGFAGIVWGQNNPKVNTVTDFVDHQVDKTSWNMGMSYDKNQRHAKYSATFNNNALGDLTAPARIIFSLTGNSTVGINELTNDGSILGQNVPNPFDGASTVTYKLTKDASAVSFMVTDVMGRIVSSEKVSSNTGTHTIKLGSYAAGVYYYTLTVDGKTSTKKMIAQ